MTQLPTWPLSRIGQGAGDDRWPVVSGLHTGIVVLKLVAYDDRPEHRPKDILDISLILRHYFDTVEDEIYQNHNDLFSDDEFDITKTAARVLGRQMKPILALLTILRQHIEGILYRQISLGDGSPVAEWLVRNTQWSVPYASGLLRQLLRGLGE